MKRNHMFVGLVLLVGALAGFVADTSQSPQRWEYGQLVVQRIHQRVEVWEDGSESSLDNLVRTWVAGGETRSLGDTEDRAEILRQLGCPPEPIVSSHDCLGGQGWEFVAVDVTPDPFNGWMGWTKLYYFKRPVR